jgi:hypothetical protein
MSLTIITNPGVFSPKYVYQRPPEFHLEDKPELAVRRYYEKQYQIWEEGYYRDGVKVISGKLYFYIQEVKLKTGRGEIIRPIWRDVEDLVFNTIDECLATGNKEDLFILKRREIGLTSMIAAGLSFWFARTNPGSTLNLTSADKKRFVRMFEDKIIVAYNNMSPYIMNCKPKNINRSKNDVYLKVEMKKRTEEGVDESRETEFNLIETSQSDDSVANFSSSRTPFMFVDEIFLHPRINELLRSAKATMMDGAEKFGFFLGGGTCEDTLSQEELAQFHTLWTEAERKGIRTLFLPAWMGLKQFSTNGWSDEKKGTEWVLRELENAEKSSDPNDAVAWKKNYPLTTDDIWKIARGKGFFEQDVMDILERTQERLIETGKNEEYPAKLVPRGDSIEIIPDSQKRGKDDGGFWVIEPPMEGQEYYQEIDGVASGKEDGDDDGSWIASTIYKGVSLLGDHYAPVCHYFERPNRLEDGYRNMVTQFHCYNKYNGMKHINYETNAGTGGNFGSYLDAEGLLKFVMKRKDITAKGNINVNKLGTAVNDVIKIELAKKANPVLRKYGHLIRSRMLIASLLLPKSENADLRSNYLIFMASIDGWNKPAKKAIGPQFRYEVRLERVNGQNVHVTKKIPIGNQNVHPQHLSELQVYTAFLKKKYGDAYYYNNATGEEKQKYRELKGLE